MSYDDSAVDQTIRELHVCLSKINQIKSQIREELESLSRIQDVVISEETTIRVQKEVNGEKQFNDAEKTIPDMIRKIIPRKTEKPMGLDGKKIADAKRLEIYNHHKTIADQIMLKVNLL